MIPLIHDPLKVLQKYWGYSSFRPMQDRIVESILEGNDTMALLPTGGGKSICYQVPGLCMEGVCLVISPLIALMQDQVQRLKNLHIEAEAIHSGMSYREIENALSHAVHGKLKFLYLSPERLATSKMRSKLREISINLVAIDEAHCIAQWGHDFRPSYLHIADCREWTKAPFLALTATATKETRSEIATRLKLENPQWFEMSFRRPNLSIIVREEEHKNDLMLHLIHKIKGPALIYVRNRKSTKELSENLSQHGLPATFYHAGLNPEVRKERQLDWILNKVRVIVATNAFGMGIDKPDVRLVLHQDLPGGLEEYFQEIGRAGRDQQRSFAVLMHHKADIRRVLDEWENRFPEISEIKEIYRLLAIHLDIPKGMEMEESLDFDLSEFCTRFSLKKDRTLHALRILEQSGKLVMTEAVWRPSRVFIEADDRVLNNMRKHHPRLQMVIDFLLRAYEGILTVPVPIQEAQIARITGLDVQELIATLRLMDAEGVLKYLEAKSRPQIMFSTLRVAAKDLELDRVWYSKRKAIFKARLDAMVNFLSTRQCRQVFISGYFGQEESSECGVCDNCIEKRQKRPDADELQAWKNKICTMLADSKKAIPLRMILYQFPINRRKDIEGLIEEMIAKGQLIRNWDLIRLSDTQVP